MKMEVLSVQNHHIQKQFGVISSTKVKKDWTSSLQHPLPKTNSQPTNFQAATTTPSTPTVYNSFLSPIEHSGVDVLEPQHKSHCYTRITGNQSHMQHSYDFDMETASATSASPKDVISEYGSPYYSYNNNLLYCTANTTTVDTTTTTSAANHSPHKAPLTGIPVAALTPSPVSSNLSTPTEATEHFTIAHDNDVDAAAINDLSQRLQAELRAAKSRHLSCTEVSLPSDLTPRIAADMIKTSEREPCGVRGCAVFIDFENETGSARRIASFKVDPNTVSTFELFLTLKQSKGGWTSLLPQFLKNLTRSSTILISPHFTLSKHKLYVCE